MKTNKSHKMTKRKVIRRRKSGNGDIIKMGMLYEYVMNIAINSAI